MTHLNTLTDVLNSAADRDNPALVAWLVDRYQIDVAELWPDLDDAAKTALVDEGMVSEVIPDVICTSADDWRSDWQSEYGCAWSEYELEIRVDGETLATVQGWHVVGEQQDTWGNSRGWCEDDGDDQCHGLPYCDGWTIRGGDNLEDVDIPCWRGPSGGFLTFDRDELGDERWCNGLLSKAAGAADHGESPDIDELTLGDLDETETLWAVIDGKSTAVEISHGGLAPHQREADQDLGDGDWRYVTVTDYYVEGWTHDDCETIFPDRDACIESLEAKIGRVYHSEELLIADILDDACRAHGEPDGITVACYGNIKPGNGHLHPDDQPDDQYHPTVEEAIAAKLHGWDSLLETLVDAFGRRACLDACKAWRDRADTIIASQPVLVTFEDSIAAGNCTQETEQVRLAIQDSFGDGVTAVDAQFLLSLRDDAYSRRACRVAAMRS